MAHSNKYCFIKFLFHVCVSVLVCNVKPLFSYGLQDKMFKNCWTLSRGGTKERKINDQKQMLVECGQLWGEVWPWVGSWLFWPQKARGSPHKGWTTSISKHKHQRRKSCEASPNGAKTGMVGAEQVAERAKDERWLNLGWERPWQPWEKTVYSSWHQIMGGPGEERPCTWQRRKVS